MESRRTLFAFAAFAGAQLGMAIPAQAATAFGLLPASIATSLLHSSQQGCSSALQPNLGDAQPKLGSLNSPSKASAILGGQVSRLELIAQQQAGLSSAHLAESAVPSTQTGSGIASGTGSTSCTGFALPRTTAFQLQPGLVQPRLEGDDFLASKRLPIRHTSFDASWNRVRDDALPLKLTAAVRQATPGRVGMAALAAVNAWTNTHVRYVDDKVLYRQADYWAPASQTLQLGAGDCEDIAIAKMELLAALGVSRSDMYLTIARDLARNADHALLVVKLDGKFWLLDNATNELLDARQDYDYRPIMSFNNSQKWLHGY